MASKASRFSSTAIKKRQCFILHVASGERETEKNNQPNKHRQPSKPSKPTCQPADQPISQPAKQQTKKDSNMPGTLPRQIPEVSPGTPGHAARVGDKEPKHLLLVEGQRMRQTWSPPSGENPRQSPMSPKRAGAKIRHTDNNQKRT